MTFHSADLDQLVQRVQAAAGKELESLILYGSAARDEFHEQLSDINLLCVVRAVTPALLDRLSPVVEWWSKTLGHRPPQVLSSEELHASADVFAIETLDIKAAHRILAGDDVLSQLHVPMNLHRVQLEHDLRTMLLRLRQHYLLFHGDEAELQKTLAKSASAVVTLLRHALLAAGHRPTMTSKRSAVEEAGRLLGVDISPVLAALDQREGRRHESSMMDLYNRYVATLAAVVRQVDSAAPKAEWRRVATDQ